MKLRQVAQHVEDLNRAKRCYEDLFQTEAAATFDPPGLVFFTFGDLRLLLDKAAPSALLYYSVDNLPTMLDRLREQGVKVTAEPHVIFTHDSDVLGPIGTQEWHAFVADSEGNQVGLVELRAES